MSRLGRCSVAAYVMLLVSGVFVGTAAAAPPSNDTEAGAIAIGPLPFTHSMDTSEATTDGPRVCSTVASVFYKFTPDTTSRVQVDLIGSEYVTALGVYTRAEAGDAQRVACNRYRFAPAAGVRFNAHAGVTYFLMVGQCCGHRGSGGGPLVLTAAKVTNVALGYAFQVSGGTVDPATGIATLTGTMTCNEHAAGYREMTLRQLRQGIFVARRYFYLAVECTPDNPAEWSVEVDTDTGIAFGSGPATVTTWYESAWDGWRDYLYNAEVPTDPSTITLQ
jgi:hypothetical protein